MNTKPNTSSNRPKSRVTLAGAGPGDPGLITVKALKAIEQADVILYDALVNPELLNHARPGCILQFVGKRRGVVAMPQEQINATIVAMANQHGHVVRLKGGDPFVFGRGMEEVMYIAAHRLPVEVIPGVSSSIAAPALAGIPVTHRGVATSFWVLTATQADGSINQELRQAAQSNATVVILMGFNRLREIAEIYHGLGKENTPAAIVSLASLPNQNHISGPIGKIHAEQRGTDLKAPATIVIGEAVRLGSYPFNVHAMDSFTAHPTKNHDLDNE